MRLSSGFTSTIAIQTARDSTPWQITASHIFLKSVASAGGILSSKCWLSRFATVVNLPGFAEELQVDNSAFTNPPMHAVTLI